MEGLPESDHPGTQKHPSRMEQDRNIKFCTLVHEWSKARIVEREVLYGRMQFKTFETVVSDEAD